VAHLDYHVLWLYKSERKRRTGGGSEGEEQRKKKHSDGERKIKPRNPTKSQS
jgi:hypothetical protein